jgi:hypothetical protein
MPDALTASSAVQPHRQRVDDLQRLRGLAGPGCPARRAVLELRSLHAPASIWRHRLVSIPEADVGRAVERVADELVAGRWWGAHTGDYPPTVAEAAPALADAPDPSSGRARRRGTLIAAVLRRGRRQSMADAAPPDPRDHVERLYAAFAVARARRALLMAQAVALLNEATLRLGSVVRAPARARWAGVGSGASGVSWPSCFV